VKVRQESYRVWLVPSRTQPGVEHRVAYDPLRARFICDCLGYVVHRRRCSHIQEVVERLREEVGLDEREG